VILIKNNEYYLLVFNSHNFAAFLYSALEKKGYKIELISTPCKISPGCSQSLKFDHSLYNIVKEEAIKSQIPIKGIYKVIERNGNKEFFRIE